MYFSLRYLYFASLRSGKSLSRNSIRKLQYFRVDVFRGGHLARDVIQVAGHNLRQASLLGHAANALALCTTRLSTLNVSFVVISATPTYIYTAWRTYGQAKLDQTDQIPLGRSRTGDSSRWRCRCDGFALLMNLS